MITKRKKWVALLAATLCGAGSIQAQENLPEPLTIEACYTLARAQYPLIRWQALIEKTKTYTLENAAKDYWPQLSVSGQASYQSDVTELPISLPGISGPSLSKDQYKVFGEVTQTLYDNGAIRSRQQISEAAARTEQQRAETELYRLSERINQLFFGVLMTDAQIVQIALLKADIQSGLDKVNGAIANGTALRSSADVLRAQLLQTEQRSIELAANRRAYTAMLSVFIGRAISDNASFAVPQPPVQATGISRPELRIYELQKTGFEAQEKLLKARSGPRLGLFLQGGAGRPALNFLSNEFEPYYIGGLRLGWNIGSYYTLKHDRQLLDINKQETDVQRDIFLFNTKLGIEQYSAEIRKLRELLATDEEIVQLRSHVKAAAAAQLSNGVITGSDYLREANAEDRARQDKALHGLQLLLALFNYQTTTGN